MDKTHPLKNLDPDLALKKVLTEAPAPENHDTEVLVVEGFVKVHFRTQHYLSSTVLRINSMTTAFEVCQIMAQKIPVGRQPSNLSELLMIYPKDNGTNERTLRTLEGNELILPLQQKHSNIFNEGDNLVSSLKKSCDEVKLRTKFFLQEKTAPPFDIDRENKDSNQQACTPKKFFVSSRLGKVLHSGYMLKASRRDRNLWRKRWFILKTDYLVYFRSSSKTCNAKAIMLAHCNGVLPQYSIPWRNVMEIDTGERKFKFYVPTLRDRDEWISLLQKQIGISKENYYFSKAAISIRRIEQQITGQSASRNESPTMFLLQQSDILSSLCSHMKHDHVMRVINAWLECERFRDCILGKCSSRRTKDTKCTTVGQWSFARKIIDTKVLVVAPDIRLDLEAIYRIRQTIQAALMQSRLQSASIPISDATPIPPEDLLLPIQKSLYEHLEKESLGQILDQVNIYQFVGHILKR